MRLSSIPPPPPPAAAVFYDHLYDSNAPNLRHVITRLIALRSRLGIHCRSKVRRRRRPRFCKAELGCHQPRVHACVRVTLAELCSCQCLCRRRQQCSRPNVPAPMPWSLPLQVKIVCSQRDVYAAEIDEKLVMKIGPGDFKLEGAVEEAHRYQPGASWGGVCYCGDTVN